jgi:hypothetical protein
MSVNSAATGFSDGAILKELMSPQLVRDIVLCGCEVGELNQLVATHVASSGSSTSSEPFTGEYSQNKPEPRCSGPEVSTASRQSAARDRSRSSISHRRAT